MVRIVMVLLLLLVPFNWMAMVQAQGKTESPTPHQMRDRMRGIVIAQANRYNMPPLLLVETCIKESNLQYDAKGLDTQSRRTPRWRRTVDDYSYGLCQVKLGTARWVWSRLVPKEQRRYDIEVWHLTNPVFNSATAAIFLVWLKSRFGTWRKALAAYNAGPYNRALRMKTKAQLSLGKGSYSMTIWMRWNVVKMVANFGRVVQGNITLAQSGDGN